MSHESDQDRSRHAAGTFIDCTKWLADTSPDLGIGSVVRSSSLTLFDAMIAIEVFADRMDSGLVTLPDLRTPPHDDAFLMKLAHFSPEQVSSTLVLLFRAFSTYVSGAGTLSNTIFTSVFVRNAPAVPRQDQLGPEVLRIFVFCLIRCSFYFVNLFSCLGLYEEEDFSLEQASLDLLGGLDDDTLLDKLGTLIRRLPDAEQADGIAGAVPLLLFVKNLLILLTRLGSSPHSKLDEAVDCLRQAISTFTVPQSHPTIVHVADCHTDDQSTWDLGFNPRALRHLTIHCPPRNAPWMSLAEALGLWDRISKQSVAVAQLQNGPPLSPVGLLSVIEHATAWEQAPRSFLHLALFTQSGLVNGRPFQHLMEEWLLEVTGAPFAGEPRTIDSLVVSCVRASVQGNVMYRSANVVRSLESEVRGQLAHLCNLLYRAAEPVIRNAFRAFVHNPARTRRLLFKVCQQLASLESSADSIDSEIAILLNLPDLPGFFGHWIGYLKDRWALLQLDFGQRLDLFAFHEHHSLLYVHSVLASSLRDRIVALCDCHSAALMLVSPPLMAKPKTKKRPGKSHSVPNVHAGTGVAPRTPQSAFVQAELAHSELRVVIAAVSMSVFFLLEPLPVSPSLPSLLGELASVPDRSTLFHQRFRHWARFMSPTTSFSLSAMESVYRDRTKNPVQTLQEATKALAVGRTLQDAATPSFYGACRAAKEVLDFTELPHVRACEIHDALGHSASALAIIADALRPVNSMPANANTRSRNKHRGRGGQRQPQSESSSASQLAAIRTRHKVTLTLSLNYCIGLLDLMPQQGFMNQELALGVKSMSVSEDPRP